MGLWNEKRSETHTSLPVRKGVIEDIKDPSGNNRVKVRISGIHTPDKRALPTEKLPWVNVKPAIGAGGGKGQTANLQIGQVVDCTPMNLSETVFEVTGMSNILPDLKGDDRNFGSVAKGDDRRIGKFLAPLLASGDAAKLALTVYTTAMAGLSKYISGLIDDGSGGLVPPPVNPPKPPGDGFEEQMKLKCSDIDWTNDPNYNFDPTVEHYVDVQEILDYVPPGSPAGTLPAATAEGYVNGEYEGPDGISIDNYDLNIYSNDEYLIVKQYVPGHEGDPSYVIGREKAQIINNQLFIPKDTPEGIWSFDMTLRRKRPNNQKLSFILTFKVGADTTVHPNNEPKPDYTEWPPNESDDRLSIPIPDTENNPNSLGAAAGSTATPQSVNDKVAEINITEPKLTNDKAEPWYCEVKDNGRISIVSDATKGNEMFGIYHSPIPHGGEDKDGTAVNSSQSSDMGNDPKVCRFEMNPQGEVIQKSVNNMYLISPENLKILVENTVQQKVAELWTLHCPLVQIKGDVRIEGKLLVTDDATFKDNVKMERNLEVEQKVHVKGSTDVDGEVTAKASGAGVTLSGHKHPDKMKPPVPGT